MSKTPRRRTLALLLFILVGCMLLTTTASAAPSPDRRERELATITDTRIDSYPAIDVHTEQGSIRGCLIQDTTYVALRAFADCFGGSIDYRADARQATVHGDGLTLTASDGGYIVYANGRPLFCELPCVILSDGRMYAPVRTVAKAYGLSVRWNGAARSVTLGGSYTPLTPADRFYRADEVYWLARIISAESRGEVLLGQIAVGCVVLNRTKSPHFPSTVYGVIFDRTGGIQFTPAATGSVYRAPTDTAVLAAKICLEGYCIDEEVLFFLEPRKSTSSWVPTHRRYLFTVGNHDFYA